jgi:6-phosphogluconate dehydrogenase
MTGEDSVVEHLGPLFETIARGGQAEPTPGRTRTDGTAQDGYLHCGPNGAGTREDGPQRIEYG